MGSYGRKRGKEEGCREEDYNTNWDSLGKMGYLADEEYLNGRLSVGTSCKMRSELCTTSSKIWGTYGQGQRINDQK
jgi:hypothetical protein